MGEITIEKPVFDGRRLTSKVSTSDGLKKYLKNRELFIEYDTDIYANESILNIPLTATILPLAWLTGSDIHVSSLDKTFKESMDPLKQVFMKMYPKASFATNIRASELVENKITVKDPEKKNGLLFSGGVDSTYSLITNLGLKPQLVTMWRVDNFPYPEHREHWESAISIYREFAEKKALDFFVLKTNVSQILDNRRIEHQFYKELYDGTIRNALQHTLMRTPIAAPLSVERFNHLIIAGGSAIFDPVPSPSDLLRPRATRPWTDEKIVWANLTVKHHGSIDRNEKIRAICDYLKNDHLTLRVCLRSKLVEGCLNDNVCEKCLRTIAAITLAGGDPEKCGFHVDESTFKRMRHYWEKINPLPPRNTWRQIQSMVPEVIENDIHGSKEFFDWFRGFDFEASKKNYFYRDLYTSIPYVVAKYLDKIYQKYGINIHEPPDKRE